MMHHSQISSSFNTAMMARQAAQQRIPRSIPERLRQRTKAIDLLASGVEAGFAARCHGTSHTYVAGVVSLTGERNLLLAQRGVVKGDHELQADRGRRSDVPCAACTHHQIGSHRVQFKDLQMLHQPLKSA